jgi:ribonuclease HIII
VIIGIDESGKGDFFGPLVIASVLAGPEDESALRAMGVRDSKQISNGRLLDIDAELRTSYPCETVVVGPAKYNQLYRKIRNLNKLLAWGHARAIENILEYNDAERAISDKFGKPELIEQALMEKGRKIKLEQIVRGESYIQVAAASIVARAAFIRQIDRLSQRLGIRVPRGAGSPVDIAAMKIVQKHGERILEDIAKCHFKNYQRVTGQRAPW